jgi:DNA-binding transcriptional MerR regulator
VNEYLTPGEVAARFDVSHDTLRYYERAGVLGAVERSASGHRRYRSADVELLDLVRCLRETGMPIAALRTFADLVRAGEGTVEERIELLVEHDAQLGERIEVLTARRRHIQGKIAYYRSLRDGSAG